MPYKTLLFYLGHLLAYRPLWFAWSTSSYFLFIFCWKVAEGSKYVIPSVMHVLECCCQELGTLQHNLHETDLIKNWGKKFSFYCPRWVGPRASLSSNSLFSDTMSRFNCSWICAGKHGFFVSSWYRFRAVNELGAVDVNLTVRPCNKSICICNNRTYFGVVLNDWSVVTISDLAFVWHHKHVINTV